MFETREWPGRRENKCVHLLLSSQLSEHLGEAKIVANAEAQLQTAEFKARERIAWSKARVFFYWLDCVQMSLAIFPDGDESSFSMTGMFLDYWH
jgi:hypothetical protein